MSADTNVAAAEPSARGASGQWTRRRFLHMQAMVLGAAGLLAACGAPASSPPAAAPVATAGQAATPVATAGQAAAPAATAAAPVATAGQAAPPAVQPTAAASSAQPPKRGGIFVVGGSTAGVLTGQFDPHLSSTASSTTDIVGPAYETLLDFDPSTAEESSATLVPGLAKSWTISDDGKTYTFELFQGVKFHDGMPLTSEDVRFSLERIRTIGVRKALLASVDSIETRGDFTVVMKLKAISQSILGTLASLDQAIVPKHVVEQKGDLTQTIVGSGPWKFKSFRPNEIVEYERNPDYHVAGYPLTDGLTFVQINDSSAQTVAFATRKIDMIGPRQPIIKQDADILRGSAPTGNMIPYQDVNYRFIGMSTKFPPFNDVRVRQAIAEAIDKQALLSVHGDGDGQVAKGFYSPTMPHYLLPDAELQTLPGFGLDMEARRAHARSLLASAGFANGLEVTIVGKSTLPFATQIAELVPQHLARVGITARTKIMDAAEYDSLEVKSDIPFRAKTNGSEGPDPDSDLFPNFGTGGNRNFEAFSDPQLDKLLTEQSVTLDQAKRNALVLQIQRLLLTSCQRIPLWWPTAYRPVQSYVKGFVPPVYKGASSLRFTRVWLDK